MYWSVYDLKIFLFLALVAKLNVLNNFGRRHHEEHFCEIILNLEMPFKDISHLELW